MFFKKILSKEEPRTEIDFFNEELKVARDLFTQCNTLWQHQTDMAKVRACQRALEHEIQRRELLAAGKLDKAKELEVRIDEGRQQLMILESELEHIPGWKKEVLSNCK